FIGFLSFAGGSFKFQKRSHLFVRVHNEDRSPFGIHGRDPAQTPTGFAELICNGLPVPNWHEAENAREREYLLVEKSFSRTDRLLRRGPVKRAFFALVASFVIAGALAESPEPTKLRITTWNLEWFPNGSAHGCDAGSTSATDRGSGRCSQAD